MLPNPAPQTAEELAAPKKEFKGRLVSGKKANGPFLVQERHKARMAARRVEEEKKAKGRADGVGGGKTKGAGALVIGLTTGLLRYAALAVVASLILSRMVTEEWFWGYNGKYVHRSYWFPPPQQLFTPESLARHSGSDSSLPLLLAIDRQVYDVSGNRGMYGPGGSYNHFAGRDASRAFVTGCFKTGLTHDLRGLDEKQQKGLEHWKSFFENSPKYPRVGTVRYPPIAPDAPLPPPCNPKQEGGAV